MSSRTFLLGAVGATLLAVLVGAYVVGSPYEARRQTFDDRRYQELSVLARTLLCLSDNVTVLPSESTPESLRSYCGARGPQPSAFRDDETGELYRYTRKSDEEYSVCAKFHNAARTARLNYIAPNERWSFDANTGCITGRIR
jgi:hypothetical protein